MISRVRLWVGVLVLVVFVNLTCGTQQRADDHRRPAQFLLDRAQSFSLQRASEVRVFVGDSLWEYINGGAELYHLYDFVEVATADYTSNDIEIVVDIYQFSNSDNAFGLYSQLKPNEPQGTSMGVDGFSSETNLIFVKGEYVVMITGFEASEQVTDVIENAGRWLEQTLPGSTSLPTSFALLPENNAFVGSERIHAESFLGRGFLTDVYVRRYALDADTLTLFITDGGADKFKAWKAQLADSDAGIDLAALPFEPEKALATVNDYYGTIVAGLKGEYLAGVIGYQPQYRDFVAAWLDAMGTPAE